MTSPYVLGSLAIVLSAAAGHLAAQTASATRYGKACRANTNICLTKNTQFSTNTFQPPANAWIYVRVTVPLGQSLNVSGFRFLLRSLNGQPVRVQSGVFAADASNRPAGLINSGTEIYVDTTQRMVSTWVPPRVFASGEVFFIGYLNPPSGVSLGATSNANGAQADWYYKTIGGSLSSKQQEKWKYEVECDGATSNLQFSGPPRLGSMFTVYVDNSPSPEVAILFLGASPLQYSIYPLPLDLTFVGLPQCDVNASWDCWFVGEPTSGNRQKVDFIVTNNPSLAGFKIYCQWEVFPKAGRIPTVTSEGGEIVIGL